MPPRRDERSVCRDCRRRLKMKDSERGGAEGQVTISKKIPESHLSRTLGFFRIQGTKADLPLIVQEKDFYSHLIRGILQVQRLERGHLTCLFSVVPFVANYYRGLHGGAVAAIADLVSIACARTVVAEDKELFLGELSLSYLSAAPANAEVVVDASVIRSGRNVTVIAVEFKMKNTSKLVYTGRATFYNMPIAKL